MENKNIEKEKAKQTKTATNPRPGVSQRPNTNEGPRRTSRRGPQRRGGRAPNRKHFEERVVAINRVAKTVKGGRKIRFNALVVIGDGKGVVGFGFGKANEVPEAIRKGLEKARKNLRRIELTKNETIPFEIVGRHGAASVFLKPAPVGTGVIAGGPVRAVLELAGIKNIYSKVYGSRTPINVVRATIDGIDSINHYKKNAKLRKRLLDEIAAAEV